jgi:hypothetical protein
LKPCYSLVSCLIVFWYPTLQLRVCFSHDPMGLLKEETLENTLSGSRGLSPNTLLRSSLDTHSKSTHHPLLRLYINVAAKLAYSKASAVFWIASSQSTYPTHWANAAVQSQGVDYALSPERVSCQRKNSECLCSFGYPTDVGYQTRNGVACLFSNGQWGWCHCWGETECFKLSLSLSLEVSKRGQPRTHSACCPWSSGTADNSKQGKSHVFDSQERVASAIAAGFRGVRGSNLGPLSHNKQVSPLTLPDSEKLATSKGPTS